uniref:FMN-binding protein n=1 Tax=candidate division WOR-3 bacterium TaxID=2052148 RepID=A0A7C3UWS9_UNCW3
MSLPFRSIIILLGIFSLLGAQEAYICVWRNPERTMSKIFPDAFDYKTVNQKISAAKRDTIEERLKGKLLPGQREVFTYYELYNRDKKLLGYILAASQKGEYGAIEFIFGLDKDLKIKNIYIQRARERDTEFKKKDFLNQFLGKGVKDAQNLDKLIKGKRTTATSAIITGVKKELIAFEELVLKMNKNGKR